MGSIDQPQYNYTRQTPKDKYHDARVNHGTRRSPTPDQTPSRRPTTFNLEDVFFFFSLSYRLSCRYLTSNRWFRSTRKKDIFPSALCRKIISLSVHSFILRGVLGGFICLRKGGRGAWGSGGVPLFLGFSESPTRWSFTLPLHAPCLDSPTRGRRALIRRGSR